MAQAAWQAALGGPHPGVIVEGSAWEWQGGQGSQGEASQSTTILLKRTSHGPLRANLVTSQPPAPYSPSLHLPPPIISHCLVPALWGTLQSWPPTLRESLVLISCPQLPWHTTLTNCHRTPPRGC